MGQSRGPDGRFISKASAARSAGAKQGWKTRRAHEAQRSEAAKQGWKTRRAHEAQRSEAARQGWKTRRAVSTRRRRAARRGWKKRREREAVRKQAEGHALTRTVAAWFSYRESGGNKGLGHKLSGLPAGVYRLYWDTNQIPEDLIYDNHLEMDYGPVKTGELDAWWTEFYTVGREFLATVATEGESPPLWCLGIDFIPSK